MCVQYNIYNTNVVCLLIFAMQDAIESVLFCARDRQASTLGKLSLSTDTYHASMVTRIKVPVDLAKNGTANFNALGMLTVGDLGVLRTLLCCFVLLHIIIMKVHNCII